MLRSCLSRLVAGQRAFASQIRQASKVIQAYKQSLFQNEDIKRITTPHTMIKKLEKLRYKKNVREASQIRIQRKQKDLIITCNRKEFNHYRGQKYKELSVKELASSGWKHKKSRGDYFTILPRMGNPALETDHESFSELGLDERIVKRLQELGFKQPTNIQSKVIPVMLEGKSCHCAAETGNGKTLAYLLPILEKILKFKDTHCGNGTSAKDRLNRPIGMVVVPSRELADQVHEVALKITEPLGINVDLKCGGRGTQGILKRFEVRPMDLVIATPGILSKLLSNKYYNTDQLSIFALDEVDTLFDDSFVDLMIGIIKKMKWSVEKPVQVLDSNNQDITGDLQGILAGATMPKGVKGLLEELLELSSMERIRTPFLEHILPHVAQKFIRLGPEQKLDHLTEELKSNVEHSIPTIVFCNRPETVCFLDHYLKDRGLEFISFHANMPQKVREGRFQRFQDGEVDVMVCTDIASRGLDTVRTRQIINYDFPPFISDYIHRSGRVGRVGSPHGSRVVSYVTRYWDVDLLWKIETSVRLNEELFNVNANIKRKLEAVHLMRETREEQLEALSPEDKEQQQSGEDEGDLSSFRQGKGRRSL